MAQWVCTANSKVVSCCSLHPLQVVEVYSPEEKERWNMYDDCICKEIGTPITPPSKEAIDESQATWEEWGDDDEDSREVPIVGQR
jgi:hypothetical protein